MVRSFRLANFILVIGLPLGLLGGEDSLNSGPGVGERPKPFSVIGVTGPNRGKTHCYVCEAESKPVVIVFARSVSPPLVTLIKKLDTALVTHRAAELRSWVVFLTDSRGTLEPKLDQLAQQNTLAALPLTLVEGGDGPPSYRLHHEADVTVLLSVKQKVVATHAFRAGELTELKVTELLGDLPKILEVR